MAGAVLRATGSARICFGLSRGSWRMISRRKCSLVMIQKRAGRGQRQQPRDRLLDHGLLAVERQQLLGPTLPAQRPEAGAAPAGENHGMEVCLSHSVQMISDSRF